MRRLFPNILGNESVKNRIGTAIIEGRAPHAFLIDGPRGSGKYTLALGIAAALNCERRADGLSDRLSCERRADGVFDAADCEGRVDGVFDAASGERRQDDITRALGTEHWSGGLAPLPCGRCESCRRIFAGGHVDVKTLAKSPDKATLGVSEIKDFREDMFLSATEAEYKVYIIRDAEKMTPEAQNALLIVLEEPPRNVVILLLASGTDSILTTVKSRAQYIATSRFTPEAIEDYLTDVNPAAAQLRRTDPEGFNAAVMGADGCIGRALELIDPARAGEVGAARKRTLDLIRAASPRAGYAALSDVLGQFPIKRVELREQLEVVISALRDMIAAKRAENPPTLFFPTAEEARTAAEGYKQARLLAIYDIVIKAHDDCVKNANVTALITALGAAIRLLSI